MLQTLATKLGAYTDAQRILDEIGGEDVDNDFQQIQTPRLVFIGMQSHGKSSTVETLVGVEMLPKGRETVTKCPLEIKLLERPKAGTPEAAMAPCDDDWAKLFYTVRNESKSEVVKAVDISAKIREISALIAPNKGELSTKPIKMDLFIKDSVPLAFVDLPGLIFDTGAQQAQQGDVSALIEGMWRTYCELPETIIVIVAAAHEDFKANKAFQIAKSMDPTGERTMVVLTKVDTQEASVVEKMLTNDDVVARLGIVGVINRSDRELNEGVTLAEARKGEEAWFKRNLRSVYKQHGSKNLAKKLGQILWANIQQHLPNIISQIEKRIATYERERHDIGDNQDSIAKLRVAVQITLNYAEVYRFTITGKKDRENSRGIDTAKRATATNKLRDLFEGTLPTEMRSLELDLDEKEIDTILGNIYGVSTPLGFVENAFREIVRRMLKKFKQVGRRCVDKVYKYMMDEITKCIDMSENLEATMRRLPRFRMYMMEKTRAIVEDNYKKALAAAELLCESEESYININDIRDEAQLMLKGSAPTMNTANAPVSMTDSLMPNQLNSFQRIDPSQIRKALKKQDGIAEEDSNSDSSDDEPVARSMPQDKGNKTDQKTVRATKELAGKYTGMVRDKIRVALIQSVTNHLIDAVCENLRQVLLEDWVVEVADAEKREKLFSEDNRILARRDELDKTSAKLREAKLELFQLQDS